MSALLFFAFGIGCFCFAWQLRALMQSLKPRKEVMVQGYGGKFYKAWAREAL